MTRAELFAKANQARKSAKAEEDQKKNGGGFKQYDYAALEENVPKAIRIIGAPVSVRDIEKDPFSPKLINYSQILGDDGKKFRCIWPIKNEQSNWILWKIYNKVMSGKWDAKALPPAKIFDYAKSHPALWRRVAKNDNVENAYERGWKPQALVVMNIIDRSAMDWHRENKHYMLLSKKASDNNGTPWYEPGVPQMLYNLIFDTIVAVYNDWETYDIAVVKLGDKPYYNAYQISDHQKELAALYPEFYASYAADLAERPLTEEELSWTKYNIDELNPITSYQKINNRLKLFIQQVDEAFKTHFYDELQELVEKEKQEYSENNNFADLEEEDKKTEAKSTPAPAEKKVETKPESKADSIPAPKETLAPTRAVKLDHIKTLISKGYKGLEKLSDIDKAYIIGYDDVHEKPLWKNGLQLFQCPKCKELGPQEINVCVKCGIDFE